MMDNNYYKLDGKLPVKCENVFEWAHWLNSVSSRIVERTVIGNVYISTVFLGINYQLDQGEPLLFETMIFGGINDGYQTRYSTWDEAVEGHKEAVKLVEEACLKMRIVADLINQAFEIPRIKSPRITKKLTRSSERFRNRLATRSI